MNSDGVRHEVLDRQEHRRPAGSAARGAAAPCAGSRRYRRVVALARRTAARSSTPTPVDGADARRGRRCRGRSGPPGRGSASTGPVNSPKPSAANAEQHGLVACGSCCSRANAASIEIGAGLLSSMTSPRTSCFSNWPARRLRHPEREDASGIDRDRRAGGTPTASRPSPPASAAMPPTTTGLEHRPRAAAGPDDRRVDPRPRC